jgi:hypothetical protein
MSNSGKNPGTEADGSRLLATKVRFVNVLDYQSVQYGVPVQKGGKCTMSLNEVDYRIEMHDRGGHTRRTLRSTSGTAARFYYTQYRHAQARTVELGGAWS